MRILFFFVHPSKYHFFKHIINPLKEKGHHIDITIVTKDVLEDLVKAGGWEYTNIFPGGRRLKGLPVLLATAINAIRTIYRLYKYTRGKKYDLYISDDLLPVVGKLQRVPAVMTMFDDWDIAPESSLLLRFATHITAPEATRTGPFAAKCIPYKGNKELAHLHPKYFTPDKNVLKSFNPGGGPYYILRLVSLTASHDRGKTGISDERAWQLIRLLEKHGSVYITSERELPVKFEKYRLRINPAEIAHVLYFAGMFIGDSQTMTSEAAVLGTPALRFSDFVGKISYLEVLEKEYGLTYGFTTGNFDGLYRKVEELLQIPDLKQEWQKRREKLLAETIDVPEFFIDFIENYHTRYKK
jgi:predicted glycosyltransferase